MRYTQAEKMEIIRIVERSALPAAQTLHEVGVARSTFYRWYGLYRDHGYDGLADRPSCARQFWNRIPENERDHVVDLAKANPEMSTRELAWHITDTEGTFISESSVYRILKSFDLIKSPDYRVLSAADEFKHKTSRVHELWQTDFTYLKVIGWGWFYLSTILDDHSRYIIAWKLCETMGTDDVVDTLDLAIEKTGVSNPSVRHRPRLLSDNGACYTAQGLKDYLAVKDITHTRGAPYHPMTQGKIERYHRTMKNVLLLENYFLPWKLEQKIEGFVDYYNHRRVHESLDNLTPADVYLDRGDKIISARQLVKEHTLRQRRRENLGLMPLTQEPPKPQMIRESIS